MHGYAKQDAAFGYKRSAASPRDALRFVDELIARINRAGATGEKLFRGDSAFWNHKLTARLEHAGWQYSISVRLQFSIKDAITAIPAMTWQPLAEYPEGGEAQIAETTVNAKRLVVRRTRLIGAQAELFADWRHFAFLPNRTDRWRLSRPSIASTLSSSSRSATSKAKPSRTSPPGTSAPTARGR